MSNLGTERRQSGVFWRYWSAGATSGAGTAITSVALPLIAVSELQASAVGVSLVSAATYIAWLVIGLPAGSIAHRFRLREMQTSMDLLRAAAILSLPVAWWFGGLTLAQVVLVATLVSFATVLFETVNMTMLPAIVPKDELVSRNSLISATGATQTLAGPSLGGALVQILGAVPTVIVDSISYVVSAVLMRTLPGREIAAPAVGTPMVTMIRDGWRYVIRHPVIRPCMQMAASFNFVCGLLLTLTPLYLVRVTHAPAAMVGVLMATEGLGSLIGASVCTRIRTRLGSARACMAGNAASGLLLLVAPLGSGHIAWIFFGLGNTGFATGMSISSIVTRTHRQIASPPELLSRVMATVRFVSWGVIPIGSILAGLIAAAIGIHAALWVAAALGCVPILVLLASRIRTLHDLEEIGAT